MSGGAGESPAISPPPLPELPPVRLPDCLDPIIHLALTLHEASLGLAAGYRSRLLQPDPLDLNGTHNPSLHLSTGVPPYPLYKPLARAVERFMFSGDLEAESMPEIPVDDSLAMKQMEWNDLIVNAGIELSNMLEAVEFELCVQEPFFSQLRAGQKTVEGRCATGNYNRIAPGSLLLFNKCLLLQVQHVKRYSSFFEMLETERLENVLPGVETIEEGVQIYRKFYSEEKEMSNGVLAISVSRPASQPYISMASLLSVCAYS